MKPEPVSTTRFETPENMPTMKEMCEAKKRIEKDFEKVPNLITLCWAHVLLVEQHASMHSGIISEKISPWRSIRYRHKEANQTCYICDQEKTKGGK